MRSLAHKFVYLTAALFILVAALPAILHAQAEQRDMLKEAEIWKELARISPTSVEAFKRATEAMDKGDAMEAIRRYGEVMLEAPDWDVVHRRLGFSLIIKGETKEGQKMLRQAVELNRSPDNLISLARVISYPDDSIVTSAKEKGEALILAKEALARRTDPNDGDYPLLIAQLALDLNDVPDFRVATKELVSRHQDWGVTHYYNAILAVNDNDLNLARQEIEQAGRMGLPAESVELFLIETGIRSREKAWRYAYIAGAVVLTWAVGLLLLFVVGGILSKRTLKNLETTDPETLVSHEHDKLRSLYRKVINIAGLYYYISIPVVILLVLGLSGAIIYGLLHAGATPIKLVLVLAIGALITTYQIIKSLFVRQKQIDPGRELTEQEAPGLWTLAREVASTIGTRPVDEIRVTPGTEVAVYERGNFRERMQDKAERVLLVGVGVLNGFHQNAFRAVLAHEYGHFIHRDTAGGDMAMRVNSDMMKFARGMIASGQNTVWNLGFQFLRIFHRIFTRISHGAGRLQEALADRRSAYHFGAGAFEEGLCHVVRREIEFDRLVDKEIRSAVESSRALVNIYELSGADEAAHTSTIEEEYQKQINRETSDTDTHPSPIERFRLARKVVSKDVPAATGMVWELFANKENLTREMSSLVDSQVRGTAQY
jgi:tetratricopeptide (TPR) repeat protein